MGVHVQCHGGAQRGLAGASNLLLESNRRSLQDRRMRVLNFWRDFPNNRSLVAGSAAGWSYRRPLCPPENSLTPPPPEPLTTFTAASSSSSMGPSSSPCPHSPPSSQPLPRRRVQGEHPRRKESLAATRRAFFYRFTHQREQPFCHSLPVIVSRGRRVCKTPDSIDAASRCPPEGDGGRDRTILRQGPAPLARRPSPWRRAPNVVPDADARPTYCNRRTQSGAERSDRQAARCSESMCWVPLGAAVGPGGGRLGSLGETT